MTTASSLNDYRLLGRSGLRVSPLSLGTRTFGSEWGWGADDTEAKRGERRHPCHGARRHGKHQTQGAEDLRKTDEHHLCTGQLREPGPSLHAATNELGSACPDEEERQKRLDAPKGEIEFLDHILDALHFAHETRNPLPL